jgi:hypothetical protein
LIHPNQFTGAIPINPRLRGIAAQGDHHEMDSAVCAILIGGSPCGYLLYMKPATQIGAKNDGTKHVAIRL